LTSVLGAAFGERDVVIISMPAVRPGPIGSIARNETGDVGRVDRRREVALEQMGRRHSFNAQMNSTVCSGINSRLGYVTIMDGLPSVVVDTAVTYMGRCPKSKGEHNAEHKQFDRDVE